MLWRTPVSLDPTSPNTCSQLQRALLNISKPAYALPFPGTRRVKWLVAHKFHEARSSDDTSRSLRTLPGPQRQVHRGRQRTQGHSSGRVAGVVNEGNDGTTHSLHPTSSPVSMRPEPVHDDAECESVGGRVIRQDPACWKIV